MRIKRGVHVLDLVWYLVHSKHLIIAHYDIRYKGFIKKEMINRLRK